MIVSRRRVYPRPYFFELFTLANFLIIYIAAGREGFTVIGTMSQNFRVSAPMFVVYVVLGAAIRTAVEARRGRWRRYLKAIANLGWVSDTLRLVFFGLLTVHTYAWIKLTVPVFHPRLFDQELWDLDRMLFFGLSPNILVLNLFSVKSVLHLIDWTYAQIFFVSMFLTFTFFLSEPSRRLRSAFMSGNSVLWISGAWLYMLIPSLGPAFRFPDVWLAHANDLRVTQHFQMLLMRNYQTVLRLEEDPRLPVNIIFGIAAFPSLHVGFQAFVLFWMRRLWTSGQIIFAVFLFTIFLGSMITGWHYLIDGVAGIAMAAACYEVAVRAYRIRRALTLRKLARI